MNKVTLKSLHAPLFIWLVIIAIWVVYRSTQTLPEFVEELILKPIVFVLPILVWLKTQKKLNKQSLGLVLTRHKTIVIWGLGLGLLMASENIVIRKFYWNDPVLLKISFIPILLALAISLATAFSEEILYRGFLLQKMLSVWSPALAIGANAGLFAIGHLGLALSNPGYRSEDLAFYLVFIFVSGIINALIYERTRSVYASIASHALWNFSSSLFI